MPARPEYSATVTPFRTMVCGLPISTFTATIISLILYILSIILIFATKCPMNARLSYFLAFLIIAVLATCCMAAINMMYARYHFNCLSLSVSLLYSGSAALVILGLVVTLMNGMCGQGPAPPPTPVEATTSGGSKSMIGYLPVVVEGGSSRAGDIFAAAGDSAGESKSLFRSGHVGSYFIWTMSAIADAFQIVAHYYYG